MTPQQKELVQSSFAQVAPIAEQAAALFYGRLFELDPALKPLFRGNIEEQGRKLMATLSVAVGSLNNLEALVPILQNLGRGHVAYGVKDSHYATVGEALLWTLEQGLGAGFTPDVKDAWVEVYTLVSSVMKEAAAQVKAA
jgi:nitric oxide dioxygenase